MSKNILTLLPLRGMLPRGESFIASAAVAVAAVLLMAMAATAWWIHQSHLDAERTAQRSRIDALGSTLAAASESMLSGGDLTGVRRLIVDASRSNQLGSCQIVLGEKDVIASAEPARITVNRLPEQWSAAPADAAPAPAESVDDPNLDVRSFPIHVSGRGIATLQLSAAPAATPVGMLQVQTGVGMIGAAALLALLVVYRGTRSRLRSVGAVGDALLARGGGEQSIDALIVRLDATPVLNAWNGVLEEIKDLRSQLLKGRVEQKLGAGGGGGQDLESVCDAMWQGLVLVDDQSRVSYANGAAAALLRSDRQAMAGQSVGGCIKDAAILECLSSVVSGSLRRRSTFEVREPGGTSSGVLRFGVRPVRRGDSAAAMIIIEDVTQQRLAEEARNSFVAQATHELRTPLTNIRLYAENALEDGAGDPQFRTRCLNVINQESRRLERIVGDLLSVAEIEAGTLKLRANDVRLDTLFEELRADYMIQAKEKDLTLVFNLPPKLPVIHGDRDKIVLAMHNLIGNAIKYTPAGGNVTVSVDADEGRVAVDVADTGIGINQQETELIFEKFYRSKDERIAAIPGSGLGLALAREVIRLHQGDITVHSELEKGSTFTLTLPALLEAA